MAGTIAAAAIAKEQDGGGLGVLLRAIGLPPMTQGIAGKLAGVVTGADVDVSDLSVQIIQTVGNGDSLGQ